jgi:hypothetical protein
MTPLSVILVFFYETGGVRAGFFVMFGYRQISLMPDNEITGFFGTGFISFNAPFHMAEQGCTE